MDILSVIVLCLIATIDSLIVSMTYGIKKIKINVFNNIVVGFITGVFTFLAMMFGKVCKGEMSEGTANIIGAIILFILGLSSLIKYIRGINGKRVDEDYYEVICTHPELIDKDRSFQIEFKEALKLGAVLSFNNLGLAIGASIAGLSVIYTSIGCFLLSILFVKLGMSIGNKLSKGIIYTHADLISSIILMILALYELFF